MKTFYLFLLFSFFWLFHSTQTYSQNRAIDSLMTVVKTQQDDTNKVNTQLNICWKYMDLEKYEESTKWANDAWELSKKVKFKKGEALALETLGSIYYNTKKYDAAIKNDSLAAIAYSDVNMKKNKANCYITMGLTYYVQGKYPRALINYFESVKINEEIGNKKGMANAYNMIGIIYQYQGGYSQSLKYCYESLKIRESFADKHNMALCRTNIGIAYSKAKNYEDALQNYELALNIYKEENDKKNIAGTYVNTGNNYKYQKKYEKALENYTLAKPIFQEIKDKRSLISTVTSIGEVQRQLGNFEAASFALDEAMILAPDVNNNMSYATLYGDLADLYIKKSEKATSKADRELFNTKGEEYLKNCMKYYKITNSLSDKLLFYESSIELDSIKGDFKQAFEDTKLLMDCKLEMKDEDYVKKADLLKVQYELELKEQEAKIEEEKKQKK